MAAFVKTSGPLRSRWPTPPGPGGPSSIPFTAAEGQLVTNIPLGTFSDFNPDATASDFLGLINWGDGSPTDVATFTRVSGTAKPIVLVTGTHTYDHPRRDH